MLHKTENIISVKNIKKLKGSTDFYRIKLGTYRIGLEIKNETIFLSGSCTEKTFINTFRNNLNIEAPTTPIFFNF